MVNEKDYVASCGNSVHRSWTCPEERSDEDQPATVLAPAHGAASVVA